MEGELFTSDGNRKYLTVDELDRFIVEATKQTRAEVRTFCLVLAHTGCRISEALALTTASIDLSQGTITMQTLKQRGKVRFRSVPVPDSTLDALELVHGIRKAAKSRRSPAALWEWVRTQAYKHIKAVMDAANIHGGHASPKGLRHGFGVRAAQATRNPRLVQKWLGHQDLSMTTIYMDVIGQEERKAALDMW
jgi:integrase